MPVGHLGGDAQGDLGMTLKFRRGRNLVSERERGHVNTMVTRPQQYTRRAGKSVEREKGEGSQAG